MRCFLTSDDRVLVEWALSDTDVLKPDRTPLRQAGTFYLLDPDGEITRRWQTTSFAVQEHLGTSAYVIEGDALVDYYHDVAWGREDKPSLRRTVELQGLRMLPAAQAPSATAVRQAIDRYEAARREARDEQKRVEKERLARFERALPELTAGEDIALVWRYAGEDIVICHSTGEEVWRETDWPWMGKGLYRRLREVAWKKYGERLARFEVDVPADEYLRFDND